MTEHDEQAAVIAWARLNVNRWPCLVWLHAVPNGAALSSKRQAAKMIAEGLTKGVSDLFLPYPSKGYHGLYIEMKFGSNKPTPEQLAFIEYANDVGYKALTCWTAGEAIGAIEDYLEGSE